MLYLYKQNCAHSPVICVVLSILSIFSLSELPQIDDGRQPKTTTYGVELLVGTEIYVRTKQTEANNSETLVSVHCNFMDWILFNF